VSHLAVVSVDMFQTLVDIASRRCHIWRAFLGDGYSEPLAEEYWVLTSESVLDYFHRLTSQGQFLTLKSIFALCFADLFPKIGLDFDPERAARILATQHGLASPYEDSRGFLDSVAEKYPICLVTDTDDDMLSPLLGLGAFDSVFTSERLRSYKNDPECKLFSAVVEHYDIAPEKIIHIGDSSADVLGADRVGMRTCWLNRDGSAWHHDVKPDHVASTLWEVASTVLGVDIDGIQI
jgi:putative hydrolase of the HAD superfamily